MGPVLAWYFSEKYIDPFPCFVRPKRYIPEITINNKDNKASLPLKEVHRAYVIKNEGNRDVFVQLAENKPKNHLPLLNAWWVWSSRVRRNLYIMSINLQLSNKTASSPRPYLKSPRETAWNPKPCKTWHYFTLAEFQSDFKDVSELVRPVNSLLKQ